MTSAQLKENIDDSLVRLRTSYDACMDGYNRAMSKELAHSLRYWADMKHDVNRYINENRPNAKFWGYSIVAKFTREIRNKEYVVINYPKGLTTTAPYAPSFPGSPNYDIHTLLAPVSGGQEIGTSFYNRQVGETLFWVKHLVFIYGSFAQSYANQNEQALDNKCFAYSKAGFVSWLSQLSFRINKKDDGANLTMHDVSREKLIRRLANRWGGSHPQGALVINDESDGAIDYLMEFKVLGIPAPFTLLLKIAQDILNEFDYLKNAKSQQFAGSDFAFPPDKKLVPLDFSKGSIGKVYPKDTTAVFQRITCTTCGVSQIIQYNLIKGTPLQYLTTAKLYPKNDIAICPGCKKEESIKFLRDLLETTQKRAVFTE